MWQSSKPQRVKKIHQAWNSVSLHHSGLHIRTEIYTLSFSAHTIYMFFDYNQLNQLKESPKKRYVEVLALHKSDGSIIPEKIYWDWHTTYEIGKVIDIRHDNAPRVGGYGLKYTVRIDGVEASMYLEIAPRTYTLRWFVGGEVAP